MVVVDHDTGRLVWAAAGHDKAESIRLLGVESGATRVWFNDQRWLGMVPGDEAWRAMCAPHDGR